jgi:molybdate transport system ATP-binding protein
VVLLDHGRVQASDTPQALSLDAGLRRIVGGEMAGAVIEGEVTQWDETLSLATVAVGAQQLLLPGTQLRRGARARVLVPARDVLLATVAPVGLSVRNQLSGRVTALTADPPGGWLVELDVGEATLLARVTEPAVRDLAIVPGLSLFVLVKAESLRGHAYAGPSATVRAAR